MRPLLLLVDLQLDYLGLPGLEPSPGAVIDRAGELLAGFRSRGLPVAHVLTTVTRADDRRMRHWREQGIWRCEEGTAGHRPPDPLEPRDGEAVIHKSGFNPFVAPELDALLGRLEIDTLVVAGTHLHACVRETVLGAYERPGIASIIVADDGVASDDPVHAAITRRYLQARAARFLPVAALLAEIDASEKPPQRAPRVLDPALDAGIAAAWSATSIGERAAILERAAGELEAQQERLVALLADEIGKPVRYGALEVSRTAAALRVIARRAREDRGDDGDLTPARMRRRPHGMVAIVTPWNNPLYIAASKFAAALVYGNAVLWKPAPAARELSRALHGAFCDAGLEDGVLTLIEGGAQTAREVISCPLVSAVSITGSTQAGFAAQELCARRHVPLQAELGGNNAALVCSDADFEHAACEIAEGAFAQAGQRCTANRRVVVERANLARLLELLGAATAALPWGDPHLAATRIGPVISHERVRLLDALVRRSGLEPIVPQAAPSSGSKSAPWYPPTILVCEDSRHELVQEESFGPLLVVQPAEDWTGAIELVNGVRQGLAASIFTSSRPLAESFLDRAQAGIVKLNSSTADAALDVPFGGWKASGIGPPEHGSFDRDFYTRPQTVYE